MNTSPEGNMAPRRGWWSRNWKWVVPTGCLGILASCGCLGAVVYFAVTSVIKNTHAYAEGLQAALTDPQVQEALGTPIEPGMPQGSVKAENDTGSADFTIPLDGPKADGTLRVRATKSGETWAFQTLQVDVPGQAPINLLGKIGGGDGSEPPGRALPPPEDPQPGTDEAPPPAEEGEERQEGEGKTDINL